MANYHGFFRCRLRASTPLCLLRSLFTRLDWALFFLATTAIKHGVNSMFGNKKRDEGSTFSLIYQGTCLTLIKVCTTRACMEPCFTNLKRSRTKDICALSHLMRNCILVWKLVYWIKSASLIEKSNKTSKFDLKLVKTTLNLLRQ